jgi:hypothetical protein
VKRIITAAAVCLLLSASAAAQTRSRRSTPQTRRGSSASSRSTLDQTQTNAARIKLADQIKKLSRFAYLYGRLSKDLELTGAQAGGAEVAGQAKATLLGTFRSLSAELDELERQFRFAQPLSRHYPMLQGAAQKVSAAEAQASANQFDRAGRLLIEVVNQLTDVLLEM